MIVYRRNIAVLLFLLLSSSWCMGETIYAVVIGNAKYVVGSSTLHSGLFVSHDTARSWQHLGPRNLKAFSMDAVDSSRGRILYLAAGNGVHRSTDHGATWKITTGWRITEVLDVKVDQRNPGRVYAATAFGLWVSDDGGDSWWNLPGPLSKRYIYRIDYLDDNRLAVSADDAIYFSTDRGLSWKRTMLGPMPRGILSLPLDIYLTATSMGPRLVYTRKGAWESLSHITPPIMNTYAFGFSDFHAYAAGDSGIWQIPIGSSVTRAAAVWKDITGNLPTRTIHAMAIVGAEPIVGTFGEGIFRRRNESWVAAGLEGGQVWRMVVKRYER